MADSAVNLGMGGSSREGLGEFLDYLRTNRPVYKEGDERPYKYYSDDLMVPEQKSSTFAQRYEYTADRASPYAGMANSLYDIEAEDMLPLLEDGSLTSNSIYGKSGSNVPSYVEISPDGSFTETPIGFDDGGEVDPLAGVSNDDKRRILRIGNNNVADLVDNDYKIYTILTDRQKKGQRNFAEFEEGGIVDLPTGIISGPDGEPIDKLRYATPKEFEEGTYRHLQNLQQRMSEHLAASQNPVTTQAGVPMQANPETMRYHQEQAEELREEIDDFSTRRAEAILSYPERFQGMGPESFAGDAPVFITSEDPVIRNFDDGGIVDLPTELSSESADRGIGGLLMYEDMADPLYPARPIEKQSFGKNRGFQHGQMVKLGERDDAVGGKLLKQAGIMAPVNQVKQTVDPKVMDQMSRILGREVV